MQSKLTSLKNRTFLLGVGAQKAGTTWLHYYLSSHPQVFMSPIKELHFFGNRGTEGKWPIPMFQKKLRERHEKDQANVPPKPHTALRERIRMGSDTKAYRRFFRKRVTDERVFGEITPAYSKLDIAELEFVRKHFPQTKAIFLMRNPVDRLWSQMRFSEDFGTLEELEALIPVALNKPNFSKRGDYSRTLSNLNAVFAPEQMHFEFYDILFSEAAITRLCKFLEVDPFPADFSSQRNVSGKFPLSPSLRAEMVAKLRPQYDAVIAQFGDRVPQAWRDDLDLLGKS
ncbi:MAG: sulfotransferase [Rhodobacteraceae bacterium]|nr:sulfotransferase [Paracoccaceae bacterium]